MQTTYNKEYDHNLIINQPNNKQKTRIEDGKLNISSRLKLDVIL